MLRLLILLILFFCVQSASAVTITWTGTASIFWNDAANWSPAQIPGLSDEVIILNTSTTSTSVVIPTGYNASAASVLMTNSSMNIEISAQLTVGSNIVAPSGYDMEVDISVINNQGTLFIYGALHAHNSSVISNNKDIIVWGSEVGSPINYFFDTGARLFNNAAGKFYSRENINAGVRKEAFMVVDHGAKIYNSGQMYNTYSSALEDYMKKGIIMKNGAEFYNNAGFINLNWIRDIGVELLNTVFPPPASKTLFQNTAPLRIRETDIDTNNASYGLWGSFNSSFNATTGSASPLYRFAGSPTLPGFSNTTPQASILGCVIFGGTPSTPFNPGSLVMAPGAVIAGNGPFNNSSTVFGGATLSPGSSPGIITFTSDYAGTATFLMEIAGNTGAGDPAGHDQVIFQGALNDLANTILELELIDGFVPVIGDKFELVNGPYSNQFSGAKLPGQPGAWQLNYLVNSVEVELVEVININFNSDNVGIGTVEPETKLQVTDGDIYLETIGSGVIIKDADGNCYRITVSTAGVLVAEPLSVCP